MIGKGMSRSAWRLAALAVYLGAPVAAVATLSFNMLRLSEVAALSRQQEQLLLQMQERLAGPGALRAAISDTSGIYLPGATRTLAAALQQLLVTKIKAVSGRLIEAQELEDPQSPESPDTVVRATLDTDNDGLLNFLYDLETGLPLMTVDQVIVRELPTRAGEIEAGSLLRVDVVVRAHWRPASG